MPIIQDNEFGKITIRRSSKAYQIRIRVAPDGTLRASVPLYAPMFMVKNLLKNSRDEIRNILDKSSSKVEYINGMQIGKSHTLVIQNTTNKLASVILAGQQIIVKLPTDTQTNKNLIDRKIRDKIIIALKSEAKTYLKRRLKFLSDEVELNYARIRFSHASGRWGSCSSNGTISLNIALMKLPFEVMDYVIIHELCHTVHMNHGKEFWQLVRKFNPNYEKHRQFLKTQNPTI